MAYAGRRYAGGAYGGGLAEDIPDQDDPILAVEWSPTTGALEEPVWVDISADVRSWSTSRGRGRELERFQPGRATIVFANRERQYDSVNAAGPYFGNLKPMKRIRIRETFNGVTYPVFDGFVDRWVLDYPNVGKDATATVTATDAFKVFARTDLPSVYVQEVTADAPAFWWRLGENVAEGAEERVAGNAGSVGPAGDGVYVGGVGFRALGMIVNDPGSSVELSSDATLPGNPISGVTIPSSQINLFTRLNARSPFALEAWALPREADLAAYVLAQLAVTGSISSVALYWRETVVSGGGSNSGSFRFEVTDSAGGGTSFQLNTADSSAPPGARYYVAVRAVQSGADLAITLYLDGVAAATGTYSLGTLSTTTTSSKIGNGGTAATNWNGTLQEMAIYTAASGDPLSAARVAVHNAAGRTPWKGDDADDRIVRVLDFADWPTDRRELDDAGTTFQSAELNVTALEHIQKAGETEFGLLFVDRAGNVRFVSKASQFARTPLPITFGDESPEIGYRAFTPDDGDEVIRNRATISRLNGVAKTEQDAPSVEEFGRFQYTLEGLLHDSDSYSLAYAGFIVTEYGEQKRRITSLTVGPPIAGEENVVYPAMLALELGDAITVRNEPLGGGDPFEQVCVVEAIEQTGSPKERTARFTLSPELTESF
jgi:hypothetical protein